MNKIFFRSFPKLDVESVQTITSENDASWNTSREKFGFERTDIFIKSVH